MLDRRKIPASTDPNSIFYMPPASDSNVKFKAKKKGCLSLKVERKCFSNIIAKVVTFQKGVKTPALACE